MDPNGQAWITDHMLMDFQAYQLATGSISASQYYGSILNQLNVEVGEGMGQYYKPSSHLDNMNNSELRNVLESGGNRDWTNHQIQDFYFHSNYIEIMSKEGYTSENMPVFEQLKPGSSIYETVVSNIETTNFPDNKELNPNRKGHDYGKEFSAKDDKNHKYYEAAFRLGVLGTALKIWNDNEEK